MIITHKGYTGIFNEDKKRYEILKDGKIVYFGGANYPQEQFILDMIDLYIIFDNIK